MDKTMEEKMDGTTTENMHGQPDLTDEELTERARAILQEARDKLCALDVACVLLADAPDKWLGGVNGVSVKVAQLLTGLTLKHPNIVGMAVGAVVLKRIVDGPGNPFATLAGIFAAAGGEEDDDG